METLPNQENKEKIKELKKYLDLGMLLHGSKALVDKLEPRQSTDGDVARTTGKSFAIYAEAHDIRIPILMALFDKDNLTLDGWQSGYSGHGPSEPIEVTGVNYKFTPGYIYVLPPEDFELEGDENDCEYVAKKTQVPIKVIPVDISILAEFDDIIMV